MYKKRSMIDDDIKRTELQEEWEKKRGAYLNVFNLNDFVIDLMNDIISYKERWGRMQNGIVNVMAEIPCVDEFVKAKEKELEKAYERIKELEDALDKEIQISRDLHERI